MLMIVTGPFSSKLTRYPVGLQKTFFSSSLLAVKLACKSLKVGIEE